MSRRTDDETEALLSALCQIRGARLHKEQGGFRTLSGDAGGRLHRVPDRFARDLLARGLLTEAEDGALMISTAGKAWLRRRQSTDLPFRSQHHEMGTARPEPGGRAVLASLDESPVATLARRAGRSGEPWLAAHLAAAAERLRRDFEVGQLQPRVTANWSASVSDGRRSGDNGGLADLTDMALAARLRFDRAMRAVGPELSGVLVDVSCFLKGLETVERERQWPARSAKLVLRLALERLAGHYGLMPDATGKPRSGKVRHWGAEDYRPEIS